jgi:UDP-N-acetylglucosamine:LPS N-acetylglucosamine transferase
MRILVTSTPGAGHIHPLAPLVMALQQAGHEVLWATAQDSCARLAEYGFRSTPAGMGTSERNAALAPQMPEIMSLEPRLRRGHLFSGFFADAAGPRMRADLHEVFESFDPDLVVHETAELAGGPMAAARGLPHVTVAFGGALPDEAIVMLLERVVPLWESEELGAPTVADLFGDLYLHPFPPSFGQQPDLAALQLLRPETFVPDPDAEAPVWMQDFGTERPGLYLTFGTEPAAATAPWHTVLDAIAQQDVDCIATIGSHIDPAAIGPIPPNVQVVPYLPHHLVLDRASLVICHGGAGTLLAAAGRGLPQLVIPMGFDQWQNADALASSGAGIVAEADRRSSPDLTDHLHRLLDEDHHREAAIGVASEIAAMPSAAEYVSVIETLDEI